MRKETKTAVYDEELGLEAYRFKGIAQPFPNHFHEYYVIGFVEEGERQELPLKEYKKDPSKNVMLPAFAKAKHEKTAMPVFRWTEEPWTTGDLTSQRRLCWI